MAKFCGEIGFLKTVETKPGIFEEKIFKRMYCGDVMSNYVRSKETQNLNDDIEINNKISVVADSFAAENLGYMKYVKWMGTCWKIKSVEMAFPRLILTFGGIYNAPED